MERDKEYVNIFTRQTGGELAITSRLVAAIRLDKGRMYGRSTDALSRNALLSHLLPHLPASQRTFRPLPGGRARDCRFPFQDREFPPLINPHING